jgi:hypothetical protein
MEDLVKTLSAFEKTHSWWSSETFMNANNETLKKEIKLQIQKSIYAIVLAREATEEQFQELVDAIFEKSPRMMFVFFPVFLDYMKTQENLQETVSLDILKWYRKNGWSFPQFNAETKIEVVAQAPLPLPTVTSIQEIKDASPHI